MKKIIKRTIGALFLILAIALTQVPASVVVAISQNGEYEKKGDTLISYTGTASVVSVPVGIKTIGTESFSNCDTLESVSFPGSVESIGNGAFRRCQNLNSVTLSSGQKAIDSGAFSMCKSLSSVKLSNTLEKLGAGVFSGDSKLQTIDLNGNTNFVVEDGAIYNKDKSMLVQVLAGREAKEYKMPESVIGIERYAFWGCKNLKAVTLSSNLNEIPEYSFSNCTNLQSVIIPYSVKKISAKAFEDCQSLGSIVIPASVINIHETAFDGCNQLNINAEEGTTAYEFSQTRSLNQAALMENDESISDNAIGSFYDDNSEQNVSGNTLSENNESKGYFNKNNPADVSDADVSQYYVNDDSSVIGKSRVVANNAVVMMDSTQKVTNNADMNSDRNGTNDESMEEFHADQIIKDNNDHSVKRKEYYQNNTFKNVKIENGINKLNDLSFARSSITGIQLPDGLTSIGYGAFYHCDNLEKIIFPTTIQSIEPEAFSNTAYLNKWRKNSLADDFLIVGDGLLIAYKGNDNLVNIPVTVKKICGQVFKNNLNISSVNIPDSVIEVGEEAFSGCSNLTKINGGANITKISDRAFSACPLSQINLTNVLKVGVGAFDGIGTNAVTFSNEIQLPQLSYEKTATRLSNSAYRKYAFPDISVAAVSPNICNFEDTVIDEDYLGMRGLTVSLLGQDNDEMRSAILRYCTLLPDPATGLVKVPSSVQIDGITYNINGADKNAFKPYEKVNEWSDNNMTGIILPATLGTISDYEPNLALNTDFMSSAVDSSAQSSPGTNTDNTTTDTNATTDSNTKSDISTTSDSNSKSDSNEVDYVVTTDLGSNYPNADQIQAECVDDDMFYRLLVNKVPEEESELLSKVSHTYGVPVNGQLLTFDLKLIDKETNIPISNFESEKVIIRVPLSETMNQQNICAVSLMEDGSLETIYGTKKKIEDIPYFCFTTNHFSVYGIYAGIGDTAEIIKQKTKMLESKDDSPDTGDYFDIRYILGLAMACIGLVLLMNKNIFRRKTK